MGILCIWFLKTPRPNLIPNRCLHTAELKTKQQIKNNTCCSNQKKKNLWDSQESDLYAESDFRTTYTATVIHPTKASCWIILLHILILDKQLNANLLYLWLFHLSLNKDRLQTCPWHWGHYVWKLWHTWKSIALSKSPFWGWHNGWKWILFQEQVKGITQI